MSRTQRIDVGGLNERYSNGDFSFVECPSEYQAADILTKHCVDAKVWKRNLMLIGHFMKGQLTVSGALTVCVAHVGKLPDGQGGSTPIADSPAGTYVVALAATSDDSISCYNDFVEAVRTTPIYKDLKCYVIVDVGR